MTRIGRIAGASVSSNGDSQTSETTKAGILTRRRTGGLTGFCRSPSAAICLKAVCELPNRRLKHHNLCVNEV